MTASASTLIVNETGPATSAVALLQQTTATVYDAMGNVTATTDALGRVTAATYDALGEEITGSRGQIVNSVSTDPGYSTTTSTSTSHWTFRNLAPDSQYTYAVYVYSTTTLSGTGWESGYSVSGGGTPYWATTPTGTPLGANWYYLGIVASASAATLVVNHSESSAAGAVCIIEQTTATVYDAAGNVASTTDALGNTTSFQYDSMGDQVAVIEPPPAAGDNRPIVRSVYDADGQLVQSIDALGNSTEYHYDALGQQDLVTLPQPGAGRPSRKGKPRTMPTATSPPRSTPWAE